MASRLKYSRVVARTSQAPAGVSQSYPIKLFEHLCVELLQYLMVGKRVARIYGNDPLDSGRVDKDFNLRGSGYRLLSLTGSCQTGCK